MVHHSARVRRARVRRHRGGQARDVLRRHRPDHLHRGGSPVTANKTEPTPSAGKRTLTAKEVAARRANAAKSTGPKSAEGKAKVAENALKHGAYQQKVTPISSGPLAEDAREVAAFVGAIVDELDPQSPIESAL